MLLIGSAANPGLFNRPSSDYDVIGTLDELKTLQKTCKICYPSTQSPNKWLLRKTSGGKIIEFEVAYSGSTGAALLAYAKKKRLHQGNHNILGVHWCATRDMLLAIKMSHRFLKNSPHFLKTMEDIKALRKAGASFDKDKDLVAWVKMREEETYNYKLPNLNQGKDTFFNSNFNYIYDHDTIHEAVALLPRPAYEYYKPDTDKVFCDKQKFFALPKVHQLLGVLEETYVLALERSQIPNEFKPDRKTSFLNALEKVCTSITSGWFREFAWENYDVVVSLYDERYVDWFLMALRADRIKPYNGERM